MYAEQDLVFSYLQGLGLNFRVEDNISDNQSLKQEEEFLHHFQVSGHVNDTTFFNCDYFYAHNHLPLVCSPGHNVARTPSISEYDLGGEGDLFKAPEPIMEEPDDTFDMKAIEAMETDHLLNDILSDLCRNDLLEESAVEETFPELADVEFPLLDMNIDKARNGGVNSAVEESAMQKSVSDGCLTPKECTSTGGPVRPRGLDFKEVDLEADCSLLRRAYSEGDIKTLGKVNKTVATANICQASYDRVLTVDNHKMEERSAKLSRYRKKKMTRNFGRKIKYACRKALADNQPRIRGRFARTDEFNTAK